MSLGASTPGPLFLSPFHGLFSLKETLQPLGPAGYSAKQEFLFLTTVPEVGKLSGEKHLTEELKVSTRWAILPADKETVFLGEPPVATPIPWEQPHPSSVHIHTHLPAVASTRRWSEHP